MTLSFRTRFAPSPTGYLHLGHVLSALHARGLAEGSGAYHVRIEDSDSARCRADYVAALEEDLQWLGLWSACPVRRQSMHGADYKGVLAALRARGLVYPCFCTRAEIAQASSGKKAPDGSMYYAGSCRGGRSGNGQKVLWRLDMQRALNELQEEPGWHEYGRGRLKGQAAAFGDVVLARRDTGVSYHLCVTHDDALQGINRVTRGMDLFEATSVHRVLQALMGWPEPEYAHHPLIMEADGRKLSKRDGAMGVRILRQEGWSPQEVLHHPALRTVLAEMRL